jgi:ribonuclease P protein component|tara:strand:- start:466 stop:876 length:411 start_codon:yes stop_codon:yes gene_type:complete
LNALKHSFKKRERLKSKKEIASVFSAGKSISKGGVRFIYNTEQKDSTEAKSLLKTALAVPKKKIKKAVDRNLLKRRMKEAFRTNNSGLKTIATNLNVKINLMIVYQSDEIALYTEIEDKIILLLQRLETIVKKQNA